MKKPFLTPGRSERAKPSRGSAPLLATAVLLAFVLSPGIAPAECIDYGDFIHWVGSADTPGYAAAVDLSNDLTLRLRRGRRGGPPGDRHRGSQWLPDRRWGGHARLRLRPGCLRHPRLRRGLRERASGHRRCQPREPAGARLGEHAGDRVQRGRDGKLRLRGGRRLRASGGQRREPGESDDREDARDSGRGDRRGRLRKPRVCGRLLRPHRRQHHQSREPVDHRDRGHGGFRLRRGRLGQLRLRRGLRRRAPGRRRQPTRRPPRSSEACRPRTTRSRSRSCRAGHTSCTTTASR